MPNRKLREVIRRQNPATLPAAAIVQQACRVMRDRRIGAILVTEGDGRLAGLFTGRDVLGRVVAEGLDPAATPLGAYGGYRHLPVPNGQKIAGIVSHGDFTGQERARPDEETGFRQIL